MPAATTVVHLPTSSAAAPTTRRAANNHDVMGRKKNKRRKKKEGVGTKKWWRGVSIFGGRVEVGRRRKRVPAARRMAVYSDVLLRRVAVYLDSLLMTRMRAPFSSRKRAFSSRRRDVSVRPWSPLSSSSSSEIFLSRARRSRFSASLSEFRLFS
uniref:Uncharacterized protein n=1 Tax=Ixodes ricinus TaxID=34613 RepID=A0A6B0UXA8_IXORI